MTAVVKRDVLESTLQFAELTGGVGQQSLFAVYAGTLLDSPLHFVADGGDTLPATSLMEKLGFQSLALILGLRQDFCGGCFLLQAKLCCCFARPCSEHEALGQGIRTQSIRTVDADASHFAGCVQA